ncbi:MAG: hypothetical protein OXT72_06455 [Gammaproteobacteria bacterium]|nr:hypothetical protein [Gammaproteobacteria bacterium]MYA43381.1 hypothetical protein [Gemmatimonadota bacterium]MYE94575.1 hypothetical protein [Gemmatimonadota bacterium]MYJ10353.1 hypothetical protein [Gemmatimonadota bacterium]
MAHTFDTAAATERLTASGLSARQAEAIVAVVARAKEANADLLTKEDLRAALASLERRLVLWAVVIVGVLFVALRSIPE